MTYTFTGNAEESIDKLHQKPHLVRRLDGGPNLLKDISLKQ